MNQRNTPKPQIARSLLFLIVFMVAFGSECLLANTCSDAHLSRDCDSATQASYRDSTVFATHDHGDCLVAMHDHSTVGPADHGDQRVPYTGYDHRADAWASQDQSDISRVDHEQFALANLINRPCVFRYYDRSGIQVADYDSISALEDHRLDDFTLADHDHISPLLADISNCSGVFRDHYHTDIYRSISNI